MKKIILFLLLTTTLLANSWKKELTNKIIIQKSLQTSEELTTYTGSKVQNDIIYNAPEGMKYLLVPFKVQKKGSDKEMFDSKKLVLIIQNKEYYRLAEDSFLNKFNIKSFTKLKIRLGKQEGTIVYEVPENSEISLAYLKYNEEIIKLKK
ncbi:MAG: hypothetical protein ACRCZ2_13875 [Fusobacteriaceae bacterium]